MANLLSELPSTGYEDTPPNVLAMQQFKAKLLSGKPVRADALPAMVSSIAASVITPVEEEEYMYDESEAEIQAALDGPPPPNKPLFGDTLQAISAFLEAQPAREDIKIVGNFGRLSFRATNVSINEFGVAFIVKKDAIQFEPNINTELKVIYKGVNYNVIYAGGFFTFHKIPFTFVSFLRIQDCKDSDKEQEHE